MAVAQPAHWRWAVSEWVSEFNSQHWAGNTQNLFVAKCGINQAEDQVMWPDVLHLHMNTLARLQEQSVASMWSQIGAGPEIGTSSGPDSSSTCYQVEAQLDYRPGSEIGVGWKIGVTWSRKRGFKMAATELGYLLTKLSFWLSLWRDITISWHGGKEL